MVSDEDAKRFVESAFIAAANSHSHEDVKRNHEKYVIKTLANFQLLEFALKKYIAAYCRCQIGNEVSEEDLAELPLGVLIKRLRKVTGNHLLADRINELVPIRNELAHRSMLELIGNSKFDRPKYFGKAMDYVGALWELDDILRELVGVIRQLDVDAENNP